MKKSKGILHITSSINFHTIYLFLPFRIYFFASDIVLIRIIGTVPCLV